MTTQVSTATSILRKIYDEGVLRELSSAGQGRLDRLFQGETATYITGEDNVRFPLGLAVAGAFGTQGETDTIIGLGSGQVYSGRTYQHIESKLRRQYGALRLSHTAFKEDKASKRLLVDLVPQEATSHALAAAAHDTVTTLNGASGFALGVGSGTKTNLDSGANLVWRIPIDTTVHSGSHRYSQNANILRPGMYIQIVNRTTHAVLADGGSDDYEGIIKSVAANGASIDVTWFTAQADTNTDLTDSYAIRAWRAASQLEKYGLPDFVGDSTSAYRDEAAADQNKFPYGTTEVGLDPDVVGEWASVLLTTNTAGQFSVRDIDNGWEQQTLRGNTQGTGKTDWEFMTGPGILKQLVQEQAANARFQPNDMNDQRAMGRMVFDNKMEIYECPFMPKGVAYLMKRSDLCVDAYEKDGLGFAETIADRKNKATASRELWLRSASEPIYTAHTYKFGQRMTKNRRSHIRWTGGES